MDYYEILGVHRGASTEDIKRAYKRRAMELHPDKPGGDAEKFKELGKAYRVLYSKELREQYDRTGSVDNDRVETAENMFRQVLVECFKKVVDQAADHLDQVDVIQHLKADLQMQVDNAFLAVQNCKARIKSLEKLKKRITRKGKERNFFADVLNGEIHEMETHIKQIERHREILTLCLNEASQYKSIVEMVNTTSYFWDAPMTGSFISTQKGGWVP